MNHYPRHIGDYLRDTGHLSLLEHGVYSRLLDLYYLNDGPIPGDIAGLCRKLGARSADERTAVEAVATEFFTRTEDGNLLNKRCQIIIEKYKDFGKAQRERVMKRYSKSTGGVPAAAESLPAVANELPTEYQPAGIPTINHKPETNNHKPITIDIPPNPPAGGKGFDWFTDLPEELDTPEFREAWLEWVKYRKKIKRPFPPASAPAMWRKAQAAGAQAAIDGFETSMANGWQGTFPERKTTKANDHRQQKRDREFPSHIEVPDL
jgi:uncharacterized protein YdaU (DUF1376 family)